MTISFEEALKASAGKPRTILLGNGFSIAQAGATFSYKALLDRSGLQEGSAIRKVFATLKTFDFEEVMRALEHAALIETAYGDAKKAKQFQDDAIKVREALIHAVRQVHPGAKFDIPVIQLDTCADFLDHFESIFTLNYDLLLYWVILQRKRNRSDGFAFGEEVDGFRTFQTAAPCNTYYLHGALHLFLGERRGTKKRVVTGETIIDDIEKTIRARNQLPLFVAEGLSGQKHARINSVPYLRRCYQKLMDSTGSLFVFGHSAGDSDRHVYGAIFASQIEQLFFCVHDLNDLPQYQARLAPFTAKWPKIKTVYVKAATAPVWTVKS
jgi:hypothetical protein